MFLFALLAGMSMWVHGDLHGQVSMLDQAIDRDPQNAVLYVKRGELYRLMRHWTEAESDFNRAEQLAPTLADIHLSRARMLLESNRFEPGLDAIDRFIVHAPVHSDAHVVRGRILMNLRRHREAAAAFSTAIELGQEPTPDLYLERHAAILALGPDYWTEAIGGLNQAISRLGPIVTLELPAIELSIQRADWDDALRRLDQLAAHSPRKDSWLFRRGEILMSAGRDLEARHAFIAALNAIEALPQRQRGTAATQQLEAEIRTQLHLNDFVASQEERHAETSTDR